MNPQRYIAAFLTGHSSRGCSGLSAVQREFQRRSAIPDSHWLSNNFPYDETFPFEPPNLAIASWNNVHHYFESRTEAFRKRHGAQVAEIFSRHERVIVLAGSCGLELLDNLELPEQVRQRLHVFAIGPVSRRLPETASHLLVQGKRDWISRLFHSKAAAMVDCSHMDYLEHAETLRLFDDFCGKVLREAGIPSS